MEPLNIEVPMTELRFCLSTLVQAGGEAFGLALASGSFAPPLPKFFCE